MSASAADPAALAALAQQADGPTLEYFVSCVSELLTRLTRTAIKRTDGEMCLLKMCLRHGAQAAPAAPVAAAAAVSAAAPAAPAARPAARPAEKPASAPAAPEEEEEGPPPFSDQDMPPWETGDYEQVPPRSAPAAPAPAALRPVPVSRPAPEVREAPPRRSAAPAAVGDPAVREQFLAVAASRVSGAVRTYLKLADMEVRDGVLHIACREESMLFMKKPAVQEVLNEAAGACGYTSVRVRKQGEPLPGAPASAPARDSASAADPMADILARARALGVDVT